MEPQLSMAKSLSRGPSNVDDPLLLPMPSLHSLLSTPHTELSTLHPEPRLIFRYWQVFVETVNPLLKIVHVPTLQQRILDASWNPSTAPKPLAATMFAIYTLAVTSMSSQECQTTLGESRDSLLTRYRAATYRALIEVDFLTTRDFEVLQALLLFLFTSPESELTSTLAIVAVKLAKKMGLHHARPDPKLSFFEREMRVRVWWQLYALEVRTRALASPEMKTPPSRGEFGDIRPPMNVNDADLHPDMAEAPVEHEGLTEMMCVLMKCEVFLWFRASALPTSFLENISKVGARDCAWWESERNMIQELEAIYERKYFRYMDRRIPLHNQTFAMARLAITLMMFKTHHPRGRTPGTDGEILLSREEGELLFDLAVRWMESVEVTLHSQFSSHIFTHMTSKCHNDAVVYVISDLRRRCSGERVDQAWGLVERYFRDHEELFEDGKNPFNDALGDLTLEAWEARRKALAAGKSPQEEVETPQFINRLWEKSRRRVEGVPQRSGVVDLQDLGEVGLTADGNLDWDYWNKFLSF
ncbi:C6 transcription factor [Colletotrichum plurivorum]|uniref:C6 transcription factor n=1 Tax=Colletotrichum plurivorum TaxID=2175906 RepID=A0A8H6JE79_9PEZI|nr:C6 transcription factor [Colletotrichum plurivorum]